MDGITVITSIFNSATSGEISVREFNISWQIVGPIRINQDCIEPGAFKLLAGRDQVISSTIQPHVVLIRQANLSAYKIKWAYGAYS
ncbi:hypothetical protein D3C86_1443780 [compost metagenome]